MSCHHCKTYTVVMIRHGESEWNLKNLFCGWYDAELSENGIKEAHAAGKALKKLRMKFDVAYTSVLKRANVTLDIILKEIGQSNIPIVKTWRLNERHYGGLTGLDKLETVEKYGEEQVQKWRRSYNIPPPPMEEDHPYYESITQNSIYADGPSPEEFPKFESLELTINRTMPFWNEVIIPAIKENKNVLIAAHGNSLRGIVKTLDCISNEDIMELNLPTGIPFTYTLGYDLKPAIGSAMTFLGDEETVKSAIEKVKNQIKKN